MLRRISWGPVIFVTVIALALAGTIALVVQSKMEKRSKHALVRCMLPTGILYQGYTLHADLHMPYRGQHTLRMVDARSGERLAFTNPMCVIAYDRSLP